MRIAPALALLPILTWALSASAATGDDGRLLFERQCAACHTIGGGDRIGPDLAGATERRPREWLLSFVTAPDQMIAAGDPIAVRLYERYNRIVMPNLNLSQDQAAQLLEYMAVASTAAPAPAVAAAPLPRPDLAGPQSAVLKLFLAITAVIAVVFTWVGLSTRNPVQVDVHRAYAIRRVLFVVAAVSLTGLLFVTLPKTPYASADAEPARIIYVTARQFEFLFSEEPIVSAADLGLVPTLQDLTLRRDQGNQTIAPWAESPKGRTAQPWRAMRASAWTAPGCAPACVQSPHRPSSRLLQRRFSTISQQCRPTARLAGTCRARAVASGQPRIRKLPSTQQNGRKTCSLNRAWMYRSGNVPI